MPRRGRSRPMGTCRFQRLSALSRRLQLPPLRHLQAVRLQAWPCWHHRFADALAPPTMTTPVDQLAPVGWGRLESEPSLRRPRRLPPPPPRCSKDPPPIHEHAAMLTLTRLPSRRQLLGWRRRWRHRWAGVGTLTSGRLHLPPSQSRRRDRRRVEPMGLGSVLLLLLLLLL